MKSCSFFLLQWHTNHLIDQDPNIPDHSGYTLLYYATLVCKHSLCLRAFFSCNKKKGEKIVIMIHVS